MARNRPQTNEYKEQLWDRFREASSKINKRHQEHFDQLKEEQKENLDLKTELCVKTEELVTAAPISARSGTKPRTTDRNPESMENDRFRPEKDNTKIYERFRNACDKFSKTNEFLSPDENGDGKQPATEKRNMRCVAKPFRTRGVEKKPPTN